MNLTEIIYGVLFSPAATLKVLSKSKPWLAGVIIFLVVLSFNMMVNRGIAFIDPLEQALPIPAGFTWIGAVIGVVISVIMLFVMAGIYSLLGEIIYQNANASGLLTSLSFSSIPGILGPPLQYIAILLGLAPLSNLISFVIAMWLIVLQIIAIRESLELTTSQALVLFIIPIITIVILIGGIVVGVISLLPFYK